MITVADRGLAFMPTRLSIQIGNGDVLTEEIPVSHWLSGATTGEVRIPSAAGDVVRVEIQYRKGQLPEDQRENIEELRRRRSRPEIDPGLVPPPKPQRLMTRAMQATKDVDALLLELDCGILVPDKHGAGVPAPTYGRAPAE